MCRLLVSTIRIILICRILSRFHVRVCVSFIIIFSSCYDHLSDITMAVIGVVPLVCKLPFCIVFFLTLYSSGLDGFDGLGGKCSRWKQDADQHRCQNCDDDSAHIHVSFHGLLPSPGILDGQVLFYYSI